MRCVMLNRVSIISKLQNQMRYIMLYRSITKRKRMASKIKSMVQRFLLNKALTVWQYEMRGASRQGDVRRLEALMKFEGRFERIKTRWSLRWLMMIPETYTMNTFLHFAAQSGSLDAVKCLWQNGCPACGHNLCMETPLHIAAAFGDACMPTVKFLLRRHKNPHEVLSSRNSDGLNVLGIAESSSEPSEKLIAWLKSQGAKNRPSFLDLLAQQPQNSVEDVESTINHLKRSRRHSIVRQRKEDFSMKLLGLGESVVDDPHTSRVRKHKMVSSTLVVQKAIRRFIARSKLSNIRRESQRKMMHTQLVQRLAALSGKAQFDDGNKREGGKKDEDVAIAVKRVPMWRAGRRADGTVYYYNSVTYETSLFRPYDYDGTDEDDNDDEMEEKDDRYYDVRNTNIVNEDDTTQQRSSDRNIDILNVIKNKIDQGHVLKSKVSKLRQKLRVLTKQKWNQSSVTLDQAFRNIDDRNDDDDDDDDENDESKTVLSFSRLDNGEDDDDDDMSENALYHQIKSEREAYAECAKLVATTGRFDLIDKLALHAKNINDLEASVVATSSLSPQEKKRSDSYSSSSSWYYIDAEDKIYGPYTSEKMQLWFEDGYFHSEMAVRNGDSGEFQMLREIFQEGRVIF